MPTNPHTAEPEEPEGEPQELSWSDLLFALASQLLSTAGAILLVAGLWRWPERRDVIVGAVLLALWGVLLVCGKGSWRLGE